MKRERNAQIAAEFMSGVTTCALSDKYGIGRQRIQQILSRHGLTRMDGGQSRLAADKAAALAIADDSKQISKWGMTRREKRTAINKWRAHGIDVVPKYNTHKQNARKRGIEFRLSLSEWLEVWGDLLINCGLGDGKMVMCRKGDRGPYEVGNVFIGDAVENLHVREHGPRQVKIFREISCMKQADSVQT